MLTQFVAAHREQILRRARQRIGARAAPASRVDRAHVLPMFLDQLNLALHRSAAHEAVDRDAIQASGGRHGHELFRTGLTAAEIVHDYSDVCEVIAELAAEQKVTLLAEEFSTLARCLDDAIASAVTEYTRELERATTARGTERLGVLADEMRDQLGPAMLAFAAIKKGVAAPGGSTAAVIERNLGALMKLIERAPDETRARRT
jgi:hypothetical protein